MSPRLQRLIDDLAKRRAQLKEVMLAVQKTCKHVEVLQMPWAGSYPRRICVDCGLEELGSWWSGSSLWSRQDYKTPKLGDQRGRSVREVSSDEFYRHRISPVAVVPLPE